MKAPKNQKQLVLWYLYHWDRPFSLVDIINDSMFFKFNTRLSELENKEMTMIASRQKKSFVTRFKKTSNFNLYKSCVPKEKLLELFEKYN